MLRDLRQIPEEQNTSQPKLSDTLLPKSEPNNSEIMEQTEPAKRFKTVTEEKLKEIEKSAQSISTQKNTVWGLNIFQGL